MKSTRQAFGEALAELGAKDPRIVVLDADLAKSTMTLEFARRFPQRHFEFGIAESNMIGAAAGLALCNKVPVATSFASFLAGRLETIRVSAALMRANVKLVGTHAGLGVGEDGASQMGLEDLAALRSLAGLSLLQPADERETRQAVEWMCGHEGPVYLRLTRQAVPELHGPDYKFQPGKADCVFEPKLAPGRVQATVFTSGAATTEAVQAARGLEGRGFAVRVLNCASLAPFDREAVENACANSQRLVSVEDHNIVGGLGSAVCEAAARAGAGIPVVNLGVRGFGESGTSAELYEKHGICAKHVAEACLRNLRA